ncbi:hypothetical protein CEXT_685881 [Caerostris extrusa]|uniref:Uncharacterized protein n=1 Tax=Caerostris extrusa TaxID=172846 RepID=A0AAV4Q5Y6_CAEEX|nr:hypothetical protein CEXT_685881 [Caerostris extrusa]
MHVGLEEDSLKKKSAFHIPKIPEQIFSFRISVYLFLQSNLGQSIPPPFLFPFFPRVHLFIGVFRSLKYLRLLSPKISKMAANCQSITNWKFLAFPV